MSDKPDHKAALDYIMSTHAPLVKNVIRKMTDKYPHLKSEDYGDLHEAATNALMVAVAHHKPDMGASLSTYAAQKMGHSILQKFQNSNVSSSDRDLARRNRASDIQDKQVTVNSSSGKLDRGAVESAGGTVTEEGGVSGINVMGNQSADFARQNPNVIPKIQAKVDKYERQQAAKQPVVQEAPPPPVAPVEKPKSPQVVIRRRQVESSLAPEQKDRMTRVDGLKKHNSVDFTDILEKISKKQSLQMLGDDPKAKEIADFISDKKLRDDTGTWLIRNYRKDPSIWNDDNKTKIEHFSGMNHAKEVADVRFDKQHSFEDGMKLWGDAQNKYNDRHKDSGHLIEPDAETKKIVDLGHGWGWHDLGKGSCSKEAKAMGHCGNEPSEVKGDRVLSLRHEKKIGDKTYHEPHLTFIENNGTLGEMKGKANEKPNPRYHQAISELLKSPRIHTIVGGGYESEENFSLKDMDPKMAAEIKAKNPNLEEGITKENIDKLPQKYIKEVLSSPHANVSHVDKAMGDKDVEVRRAAVNSPHANVSHVDKAMRDKDESVRRGAVNSPHANASHVDKAMGDKDEFVRIAALLSPHANVSHVDKAIGDKDAVVRQAAVKSPHANVSHVDKAMEDKIEWVRRAAVNSPHANVSHVDKAMGDENEWVRKAAVNSPHATAAHIDKAMGDKDESVRRAAVNSPHATAAHVDKAMGDKEMPVRQEAAQVKQKRFPT